MISNKDGVLNVARYAIDTYRTLKTKENKLEQLFLVAGGYDSVLDLKCSPNDTVCRLDILYQQYTTSVTEFLKFCNLNGSDEKLFDPYIKKCKQIANALMTVLDKEIQNNFENAVNLYTQLVQFIYKIDTGGLSPCETLVPGLFEAKWQHYMSNGKIVDVEDFPFKLDTTKETYAQLWARVFLTDNYFDIEKIKQYIQNQNTNNTQYLDSFWSNYQSRQYFKTEVYIKLSKDISRYFSKIEENLIIYTLVTTGYGILAKYVYGYSASDDTFKRSNLKDFKLLPEWIQIFIGKKGLNSGGNPDDGSCEFILSLWCCDWTEGYFERLELKLENKSSEIMESGSDKFPQDLIKIGSDLAKKSKRFPLRDKLLAMEGFLDWAMIMLDDNDFNLIFKRVIAFSDPALEDELGKQQAQLQSQKQQQVQQQQLQQQQVQQQQLQQQQLQQQQVQQQQPQQQYQQQQYQQYQQYQRQRMQQEGLQYQQQGNTQFQQQGNIQSQYTIPNQTMITNG